MKQDYNYNQTKDYWVNFQDTQISHILGLKKSQAYNFGKVKKAFRTKIINPSIQQDSTQRIRLNNAYCQACRKIFKTQNNKIIALINNKKQKELEELFSRDHTLMDKKIYDYPPIYYAVRAGHYSIAQFMLLNGCKTDYEGDKSTPMHAAAYYGHQDMIHLLIQYGIRSDIQNKYGNKPIDEAATQNIQKVLKQAAQNKIHQLQKKLYIQKNILTTVNIKDEKNQIVIKKILLENYLKDYVDSQYIDAFHGTKYEALESIAKNGLKPSGDVVQGERIVPATGHIDMETTVQGVKKWAQAVFLTPSIYYAGNSVYSKQFINQSSQSWLPIVQVKVKKNSFKKYDHTLNYYHAKSGEPVSLQLRVECSDVPDQPKQLIFRSESNQNIHVIAIIFVKKGYLDNNLDYHKTTRQIISSIEEMKVRSNIK